MGAATAIMHGERDPSIAAMVRLKDIHTDLWLSDLLHSMTMQMPFTHVRCMICLVSSPPVSDPEGFSCDVVWYDGSGAGLVVCRPAAAGRRDGRKGTPPHICFHRRLRAYDRTTESDCWTRSMDERSALVYLLHEV